MLIRFDFVGGPKDGESILDTLDSQGFGAAAAYYHATHRGAPGTLFWCRTEYLIELTQVLSDSALRDLHENGTPLRGHLYEVFCRSQGGADVRVRARHVGPLPDRVPDGRAIGVHELPGDLQPGMSRAQPDPQMQEHINEEGTS
jgi:hypothetical protein